MARALGADRAESQTGEAPTATSPENEELGAIGALEEHGSGRAFDGLGSELDLRVRTGELVLDGTLQRLLSRLGERAHDVLDLGPALGVVLEQERFGHALAQGGPPDMDDLQLGAA